MAETRLSIAGMMCAGCVASVEEALTAVEGVTSAHVNLGERTATIEGDYSMDEVTASVKKAGFEAQELINLADEKDKKEQEAGGYRYLFYLFVFTTVTAWVFAFVTYRILL